MNKPFHCSKCNKNFSTVCNRKRHNEAFHQEDRSRHQCWHCNNTYARLETARKHALKVHGDTEPRTAKLTSKNPRWTPEIKAPKPWIPPPEARPRTVHRIYIPTPQNETSHINKIKQKRYISRLDPYIAVTLEEALMKITDEESTIGRLNRLQTLEDLEVSPSSSCSTIAQYVTENTENVTITTVYGIFSAHKD